MRTDFAWSFTKAAKRFQIAQPPVSRHIRDLETELGIQLFERNSSRVFLTDAGRSFLNEVRVVVLHVAQAVEAARQASGGWAGTVRLGIAKGLGDVISRILNEYLRLASKVEIDVPDIQSGFQGGALIDRKIDVGFMRPPVDSPQLESSPLFLEPSSVVLRKESPLGKRKVLHVRDLVDETLLLIDRRISPRFRPGNRAMKSETLGRDPYLVKSVIHSSKILSSFRSAGEALSLKEIVQRSGLPKTMCFRLLYTLEKCGIVEKVSTHLYQAIVRPAKQRS